MFQHIYQGGWIAVLNKVLYESGFVQKAGFVRKQCSDSRKIQVEFTTTISGSDVSAMRPPPLAYRARANVQFNASK